MILKSRRDLLKTLVVGSAALPIVGCTHATSQSRTAQPALADCTPGHRPDWARGVENQRKADLGEGTYQNPVLAGDRPDPTILKDGDDYYMTHTSFTTYPGLLLWHSRDLVNWRPLGPALMKNIGNVFAVDLCMHDGRYFIYIPALQPGVGWRIMVIWADNMAGPWSEPVDLGFGDCIDPGHIVGEDGRRYLFVNGIRKIQLTDDGLSAIGQLEPAYEPWKYPDDWIVENFAPEGPKLLRHGDYFYLVTAVGGTAGPVTGHMVIAARSKSVHGPWEHCPHNPLVRTVDASEPWWSRGHATLVEGPAGDWWMVYHGYENGFRTLGRQTLLEPIEWTDDGWFRPLGGDLSRPMAIPAGGSAVDHGMALSDDFSVSRMGTQWAFHDPSPNEMARLDFSGEGLMVKASGTGPADSSPLACLVGDRAYRAEITLELVDGAEAGLLLFYNRKAFVGFGFDGEVLKNFNYSEEASWAREPLNTRQLRMRITNAEQVCTFQYSMDGGKTWRYRDPRMEVSGYNHNTFGGFLSLRPAVYVAGPGHARLSRFEYRALNAQCYEYRAPC